jgi:protein tyrosine phosphatase (PTP) superfamily phosphohydrolase (DUF442 family)
MKVNWIAALLLAIGGCTKSSEQTVASEPTPTTSPATRPARAAAHEPAVPITIPGVANFAQISPTLYRGEQPTAKGFAELKKHGIRTIVSLRTFDGDSDKLKGTGLRYFRIFAKAWHPEQEDLLVFLKILSDPANQPVFVHCQQGSDRTGYMVAGYRIVEQGWTYPEAATEMKNFHFHTVWTEVPEALKDLDPVKIREKVAKEAVPELRTIK